MPESRDTFLDSTEPQEPAPTEGVGLCLSGGGYRAMLFHVGSLWRLIDANRLGQITRVSSVSGGSITAVVLALAWEAIKAEGLTAFRRDVVAPLRTLARVTIDERSILSGVLLPGTIGQNIATAYDRHLFHQRTLQDLPEEPRFIINATNLETGSLLRFSRREIRDWRIGKISRPSLPLCDAVAASSAFPPVLSPFILDVSPEDFEPPEGDEITNDAFRSEISLSDGGVYDNLGLQQVWGRCRTVLVSDAGGRLADDASPPGDWVRQSIRVMEVIDQQVRNLRLLQVVGSLARGERDGAFWSVRSDIADYNLADALPCPKEKTGVLASTPTRLRKLPEKLQEQLINWGYAVTDAALRRYCSGAIAPPEAFPYPKSGVG